MKAQFLGKKTFGFREGCEKPDDSGMRSQLCVNWVSKDWIAVVSDGGGLLGNRDNTFQNCHVFIAPWNIIFSKKF